MADKWIIGLHTLVDLDHNKIHQAANSHAWISVDTGKSTFTYSLMPDNTLVREHNQERGWDGYGESQVRLNIEKTLGLEASTSLYFQTDGADIEDRVFDVLHNSLRDDPRYCWDGKDVNCATWASEMWESVTGEQLSPIHIVDGGVTSGNSAMGLEDSIRDRRYLGENERLEIQDFPQHKPTPSPREVLSADSHDRASNVDSSSARATNEGHGQTAISSLASAGQTLKAKLTKVGRPLPPLPKDDENEAQEPTEGRSR